MSRKLNVDDVVQFVANGRTNSEIAENYKVTKNTAARFMAALAVQGIVESTEVRKLSGKGTGRPQFVYRAKIKAVVMSTNPTETNS